MKDSIFDKICRWRQSVEDNCDYNKLDKFIQFRNKKSFNEFHPTQGPKPKFFNRFESWVNNVDDDSTQKILFRTVPELFYIGSEENYSLYRTALNENIYKWFINSKKISIESPRLNTLLEDELQKTLFCSATDSMSIADFCHVNNIEGAPMRPDLRTLLRVGDANKLTEFIVQNGIQQIVVLEDFVGSGSQLLDQDEYGGVQDGVIGFTATLTCKPKVLICPLVICPTGVVSLSRASDLYSNVTFSPVLELTSNMFINRFGDDDEEPIYTDIREVANQVHDQVGCRAHFPPLGYRDTGSLTVLSTNCPDNVLPFIFFESEESDWHALFPRTSRVKL